MICRALLIGKVTTALGEKFYSLSLLGMLILEFDFLGGLGGGNYMYIIEPVFGGEVSYLRICFRRMSVPGGVRENYSYTKRQVSDIEAIIC